jgi:chromosome segregation ATPase
MFDRSDPETEKGSSKYSNDGHDDYFDLDQHETETLQSHKPLSLLSEHSEEGDNERFQSIHMAFEGHTNVYYGSASTTPRSHIDSPETISYHSSNVDSHNEYNRSSTSTTSETSGQRGYERDTQAFANKRSDTTPLKTPGKQASRQGSSASLTRTQSTQWKGTHIDTLGSVSRKGSVHTLSGPVTPIVDMFERRSTLSLKAKKSILDITIPEQNPTCAHKQSSEEDNTPMDFSVDTPLQSTPTEQYLPIDHGLSERELQVSKLLIRALATIESTQQHKVEELKKDLQTLKDQIEEAKQRVPNLRSAAMKMADVTVTAQEQLDSVQIAQKAVQNEEQKLRKEIGRWTSKVEYITHALAEHKSELTVATRTVKILETENKDIELSISNSKRWLEDMEALASANTNIEEFKVDMKKLKGDIEALQRALAINTQKINAYKSLLLRNQNKPQELILMRNDIRAVLGSYTSMLADISAQNEALKINLAKKDQESKVLKESSLARAARIWSQEANDDDSEATYTWESLYEDKSRNFDKLQQRHRAYKVKAEERFRPGLERDNKDLRSQLTKMKDENDRLADQISALQKSSINWESEYQALRSRAELTEQEAKQEIERLNKEMTIYVQEYKDKTPQKNPDWWSVKALQNQVTDLERQLKDQVHFLEEQRQRLQTCYREYTKTREQNEALKHELGVEETYIPSNPERINLLRIPKYESAEEIAQRAEILKVFRKKQLRAREKREEEHELIEQARRYKMGERYPPNYKERYEMIEKKNVRERWEVDRFERLKGQGLTGEM